MADMQGEAGTGDSPKRTATPSLLERLPFGSLRGALLLLVALTVLPAVVLMIRTAEDLHEAELEHGLAEAEATSRRAARDYRHTVLGARVLLKTLARLPEIRSHDVERCRPLLQEALGANEAFANIGLLDAEGRRICSAIDSERSLDLSDRPYFQAAMEHNRFTIGEYQVGRLTGAAVMSFAFPVRDDQGKPNGILHALVELSRLMEMAPRRLLPADSVLVVLDGNGRILSRDPPGMKWIGDSVAWHAELDPALVAEGKGRATLTDIDGERRHFFLTRIGGEHMTGTLDVGVGVPLEVTSAPARRALTRSLWALGAVAVLTLIAAWILGSTLILRPVRRLRDDMERLAEGDLGGRSDQVYAGGEMGRLARTFDDMASRLLARSRERDRAMEALASSKASLQAVFEATQDGILTIDEEGRIREASPTAEETFGYSAEELRDQRMHELLIPTELRELFERHLHNAVADENEPLFPPRAEFIGLRKDGERFPVELNSRRVTREGPATFTIYLRDLTDQKRLAAQFLEAQKMEAIGRLAAGIAHDFNNALTVVKGYSELILEDGGNGDVREHVQRIHHAGRQAASLVKRILAFSRRQLREPVWTDLNEVVARMVEFLPPLLGEDVELQVVPAAEPLAVKVDPGQVEQLVANLAVNARDAMPQGGRLELKASVTDVAEGAVERLDAGRYAVLSVSDSGGGIPEPVLKRIFDPFFTTKQADKGTGLGLSSCREIAHQNGGAMSVDSKVGSGTEFRVYLPCGPAEKLGEPEDVADRGQVPGGTETILVVEDDPAVRELAYIRLRKLGYKVRRATDGEDALGILNGEAGDEIDLVVTDIVMPRLGGENLGEELQRSHPHLPVLFTSAYIDRHVLGERLDTSRVAFLPKPFEGAQLARRVRAALDTARRKAHS